MKKHIVIGLALLISAGLKSQDYVPFPKEHVNWNVFYVSSCEEGPRDTTLLRYTLEVDTVIDEITYSNLSIETGDTSDPETHVTGTLSEAGRKIYYQGQTLVGGGTDEEYLLYDFTARVGDTIQHDSRGSFYSVVLGIDSVLIGVNYRKRYRVDISGFFHRPDYVIEGIGSVKNGLLGHISSIPTCGFHYWEHVCFRENDMVLYLNPKFSDCFQTKLISGVKQPVAGNEIAFLPNPIGNEVHIKNAILNKNMIFKLIDINGKTMIEKKITEDWVSLDRTITPGIYHALILDENGKVLITRRLVKE